MHRKVSLPVATRLQVKNYALYPGQDGKGLDLQFADGVTVLAGINGIGKTTLLNLLLRLILGPADPSKFEEIGRVSTRELTARKKFTYFLERVPNTLDDNATATLTFVLGGKEIVVCRFLRSMQLKLFTVNGKKVKFNDEIDALTTLAKISGLESAYNFHMVVRYLQFFSEDRLPIVWNPSAQFEFFKILIVEEDISKELNTCFGKIQGLDTDYRNRIYQLNKKRKDLPPTPSSNPDIADLDKQILGAKKAYDHAIDRFNTAHDSFELSQKQLIELDQAYDTAEIKLASIEQDFMRADAEYIALALPSLDDKLQFLMQGFSSGSGCFICGKKGRKQATEMSKKLRQGQCFVCSSTINKPSVNSVTPITAARVRSIEKQISEAKQTLKEIDEKRDETQGIHTKISNQLREISAERNETRWKLESLQVQRPALPNAPPSELQTEIEREEQALKLISIERDEYLSRYREAVGAAQKEIDEFKENIRDKFTTYAKAFLHEEVDVRFDRRGSMTVATGVSKVNIPSFSIHMTSGTHKIVKERASSDSVSESQKEFLDLSFRMALIDLVAGDTPVMLVVETPEASLDTWFMRKAADLMRKFATTQKNRKVLATSNINGTLMIPSLLGLIGNDGRLKKKLARKDSNHLINLMQLAAQATVLTEATAQQTLQAEIESYVNG